MSAIVTTNDDTSDTDNPQSTTDTTKLFDLLEKTRTNYDDEAVGLITW